MFAPRIMCCSNKTTAHSLPTFLLLLPSFHFSGQATACSFFSHVAQTMVLRKLSTLNQNANGSDAKLDSRGQQLWSC
jgi:hypothetical protein